MISVNHAARITPLINPKRSKHRDKQYTAEQEETLLLGLPDDLRDAYLFALYTGFRRGDVVSIPWSAIDKNGWLEWKPAKTRRTTDVTVYLPTFALPPLAELLDRLPRDGERILMAGRGVPWGETNLSHRWHAHASRLGMPNMRFQDIRHTTSSRLIYAGCTEAERAMILGHATSDGTGQIYIARMKELALFAYQKWWAQMNGTARVISLENARGK
jgi:integrase